MIKLTVIEIETRVDENDHVDTDVTVTAMNDVCCCTV